MKRQYVSAVLALLVCCAPLFAGAQEKNEGKLARVYTMVPKHGSGQALWEALKAHAAYRTQQGDPWTWRMYSVVNGKGLGNYVVRSGGHHWADFDAYDTASAKLNLSEHFNKTVQPHLAYVSSTINMDDDAHSHWVDNDNYRLFSITRYAIIPGKIGQFETALGEIHKGLQKQKWAKSYAFVNVVNGASGPTRILVLPRENWANFEAPKPSVMQVLASEYGKDKTEDMLNRYGSSYSSAQSSVIRYLPELSVLHESK